MATLERCERCGHALEILHRPVKRLRWTRYWWRGAKSLLTGPLRVCGRCGAVYTGEGELLAAGVVATEAERRLDGYRRDMAHLRDSFAGVVIAAELAVIWLLLGPDPNVAAAIAAGGVGAGALAPAAYFGTKARRARRDLRALREARRQGSVPRAPAD